MKTLEEWQKAFAEAAHAKFPNVWDNERRVQSVQEQLDDVRAALKVERGEHVSDDHAHQNVDERIGALIADILILAEERGAHLEPELQKHLDWFKSRE